MQQTEETSIIVTEADLDFAESHGYFRTEEQTW
jgi:hypothetical protein